MQQNDVIFARKLAIIGVQSPLKYAGAAAFQSIQRWPVNECQLKLINNELTGFTSGLAGSVDGDFDGLVVGGHLRRGATHGDHQRKTLP